MVLDSIQHHRDLVRQAIPVRDFIDAFTPHHMGETLTAREKRREGRIVQVETARIGAEGGQDASASVT